MKLDEFNELHRRLDVAYHGTEAARTCSDCQWFVDSDLRMISGLCARNPRTAERSATDSRCACFNSIPTEDELALMELRKLQNDRAPSGEPKE